MSSGGVYTSSKTNAGRVRPVSATDKPIYDIPLSSIVHAFDVCCKNKRNTDDCIEFSFEYDTDLVAVWDAIRYGRYEPDYSKCFIRKKPVLREIFASAYVDRVIQHWLIYALILFWKSVFRHREMSQKNCRIGEGALSAVTYLNRMIMEVSENYTKRRIHFSRVISKAFFMSMSKSLLWEMIDLFIRDNYKGDDIECLLYILRTVIFHQPQHKML